MTSELNNTLGLVIQHEYLPPCLSWLLRLGQDRPAVAQFTESPWELSRTVQAMLEARGLPETRSALVELIDKKLLQSAGGYVSIIRWLLDAQESLGGWDGGRRYDSAMVLWSLVNVFSRFSSADFSRFGIVDLLPKIQKGLQWLQLEYSDEDKLISSSIDGNSVFLSLIAFLHSANLDECLSAFGDNHALNELVTRVLDRVLNYVETRFQLHEQGVDDMVAYNMLDQAEVPIGLSDILSAHRTRSWSVSDVHVSRIEKNLLRYMEFTEVVLVSNSWLSFTNRARLLTAYIAAKSTMRETRATDMASEQVILGAFYDLKTREIFEDGSVFHSLGPTLAFVEALVVICQKWSPSNEPLGSVQQRVIMNKLANRDDVRTRSYELEYRLLEKEKALKAQNDLLVMETEEHERTKRSLFTVVSSAFLILISLLILRPLGAALIDIQIQNSEILLTLVTITITLIGLMYGLSGYLWRRRRQR